MSSIAFHTAFGSVRVSGRERAMMGAICNRFRAAQTGDFKFDDMAWLAGVTRPGHYLHTAAAGLDENDYTARRRLADSFSTYLDVGDMGGESAIVLNGQPVDPFDLALNSAVSWGNGAVRLAAKLHAQCEIHAYCENEDRVWLADLIDEAVACGVFRPDPWGYDGWAAVADFLRCSPEGPVVTSYSVCDPFPNPSFAPAAVDMGDDPWEAWSAIPEREQWDLGMAKLRAEPSLRINEERLAQLYGSRMTGQEFMRLAREIALHSGEAAHAAAPAK